MKYVVLIHSNPQPWGHPTGDFVAENRALPQEERAQMDADFDALLEEMSKAGELVSCEPLGDPATASLYRREGGRTKATDGPYAETTEHLAGFFLIDVADRDRAEAIAVRFSGPGETVELRPVAT